MSSLIEPFRVLQIISAIDTEAAGPSYSVPALSKSLQDNGARVELASLGRPGTSNLAGIAHHQFDRIPRWPKWAQKFGFSPMMRKDLSSRSRTVNVIHTHGLWMMPNIYPASFTGTGGPKLVLSPRGMLSPAALRYSRHAKRLFWLVFQARAAHAVDLFHATSEQEFEDIRSFGLRGPVAIVANGVDIPRGPDLRKSSKTILFLGRIHPIKQVEVLLSAWAVLQNEFPTWQLKICGPGDPNYVQELTRKAKLFGLERFQLSGPVFGEMKTELYREASLTVLPSQSENFGMTVAESLAAKTPVITTKGTPWNALEENGCGWWIDHGLGPLVMALRECMSLPSAELERMGAQGRSWMQRDFSWKATGQDFLRAYRWISEGGEKPKCVHL